MANRWGNSGNKQTLFSWAPESLQMVTAAMKLKDTCSLEENLRPNFKCIIQCNINVLLLCNKCIITHIVYYYTFNFMIK